MTWPTVWHTIAQLGGTLLLVGVGYLAGRWQRHHHQDQVEADAFTDGFYEGVLAAAGPSLDGLEEVTRRLDEAVDQTIPDGWPGWN